MDLMQITKAAATHLTPEIILLIGGTLVMCASVLTRKSQREDIYAQRNNFAVASLLCLLAAMAARYYRGVPEIGNADLGLFRFDASALAAERLTFLGGLILILMSWSTAPKGRLAEYYGCLLIILAAIPIVGASNDLVSMTLFIHCFIRAGTEYQRKGCWNTRRSWLARSCCSLATLIRPSGYWL